MCFDKPTYCSKHKLNSPASIYFMISTISIKVRVLTLHLKISLTDCYEKVMFKLSSSWEFVEFVIPWEACDLFTSQSLILFYCAIFLHRSSTATVKETNGRNGDAKDTAPPPKKVLKFNFIYLTLHLTKVTEIKIQQN